MLASSLSARFLIVTGSAARWAAAVPQIFISRSHPILFLA